MNMDDNINLEKCRQIYNKSMRGEVLSDEELQYTVTVMPELASDLEQTQWKSAAAELRQLIEDAKEIIASRAEKH